MSTPTPAQLKKLERLAKVLDNGDVELLTMLDELGDKTAKEIQAITQAVQTALEIAQQTKKMKGEDGYTPVKGKDYFDGEDGKDYILTKKDKKEIAKSIDVPVVERVIEKIETVIKEQPIVTNEIVEKIIEKEVAVLDEATVGYLEEELKRIDKKNGGYGQVVRKLRAGNNITIDETNMEYPIISVDPQITVSDTAPSNPSENDIWIDTNAYTYRAVTGTYTIDTNDYLLDCTANTFTITLPTAVGFTGEYIIKNSSNGIITIDGNGSETIDGNTTVDIVTPHSLTFRSDGTNFIIV